MAVIDAPRVRAVSDMDVTAALPQTNRPTGCREQLAPEW